MFIIVEILVNVGVRFVGSLTWEDKCGCHSRLVLGRDKHGVRELGSLVSSHKSESSRVLKNGRRAPLLLFERL